MTEIQTAEEFHEMMKSLRKTYEEVKRDDPEFKLTPFDASFGCEVKKPKERKSQFYICTPNNNVSEECINLLQGDINNFENKEDLIIILETILFLLEGKYDEIDVTVTAYNNEDKK